MTAAAQEVRDFGYLDEMPRVGAPANDNQPIKIARYCACGRSAFIHFVSADFLSRAPEGA